MSGGSFGYLGDHARWRDLWDQWDAQLEEMTRALEAYGPPAALALERTRDVHRTLERARDLAAALAEVWHAVEWHHSSDWGRDQVLEALHEHAEAHPPAEVRP